MYYYFSGRKAETAAQMKAVLDKLMMPADQCLVFEIILRGDEQHQKKTPVQYPQGRKLVKKDNWYACANESASYICPAKIKPREAVVTGEGQPLEIFYVEREHSGQCMK